MGRDTILAVLFGSMGWLGFPAVAQSQPDANAAVPRAGQLVQAAVARTHHTVRYDGSYYRLGYPGGDVPAAIGVCTDVVIRAYRALNIDLQRQVHEDMRGSFDQYPGLWGLSAPDSNIDHRRVPNLERFLERQGAALPVTVAAADYRPGDVVTWRLDNRLPHIGIVVDEKVPGTARHQIVHNVGSGPRMEDVLFKYPVVGHYRWLPVEVSQ